MTPLLLAVLCLQDPPIRVPEGWAVEKAAGPPLVERPIMAGFDDRGRLYVADSSGVNLRFDKLMEAPPHRIVRLDDADGDGRFDRSVVFAERITFPMGSLWHAGALYVCAPPSVWRFRDTDDDGVADERVELVTKFGSIGNAADVHGPFLGPDGWIYWTDGRHGHTIKRNDGTIMAGKAARVFRCKPDGARVEVVCGGGMDNPVEAAFLETGEPIVTVALLHAQP
ncbi:MAG TPA: PVC-type heme-binding CxxCH protein, partial [Planctomycetota bacterium]|nr:PVC-type heme-binding CxxCH protein [Planctomycetota bacterium]